MSLQSEIQQFTGTDHWHKCSIGSLLYTDGIEFIADKYGAYWLIDAIASHQFNNKLKQNGLEDFQLWELTVNEDSSAILTCKADTNEPAIVKQKIPYTDFPESIKLYVEGNVLLLPSEH